MKNHSNIVPQKENNNSPETKLNVMEYCIMEYWELKIAVMKELSELQEHLGSSMSSGMKSMNRINTLPKRLKL